MGVRIALFVLAVFAALWAWAAILLAHVPRQWVFVPILISLSMLASGWRGSGMLGAVGPRAGKVTASWSTAEVVGLLIAANLLQAFHRPDMLLPVGAIIVGLHFFPLAFWIPVPLYRWTGVGFLAVGILGFFMPAAIRPLVVGFGAALVLWATGFVIVLRSTLRVSRPPSPRAANWRANVPYPSNQSKVAAERVSR